MKQELLAVLSRRPRLNLSRAEALTATCKVCAGEASFFDVTDFNKCGLESDPYAFGPAGVPVRYFRCRFCGFVFTDFFDDWSPSDFKMFIYNEDYILVDSEYESVRPRHMANHISALLRDFQGARILDYGAGSGVFAAEMNKHGFDVRSYDPYSAPEKPDDRFDIVTCFEAMEHSPSPIAMLADILSFLNPGGCIIFSQALHPKNINTLRCNWWYIAPRNGHVSTFMDTTLARLGQHFGLVYHRSESLHAFRFPEPAMGAAVAARIGDAMLSPRISAPPGNGVHGWHGVERVRATNFRWSASTVLIWRIRMPVPAILQVYVPFLMAVRPEFATACQCEIAGASVRMEIVDGALFAEFPTMNAGEFQLTIRTPELVARPPDMRELGIAFPVSP